MAGRERWANPSLKYAIARFGALVSEFSADVAGKKKQQEKRS